MNIIYIYIYIYMYIYNIIRKKSLDGNVVVPLLLMSLMYRKRRSGPRMEPEEILF